MIPPYLFSEPLQKGIIKSRPNRFVMFVESKGKLLRCRCPSPTKIGKLKFVSTPCFLSRNILKSKTSHTVEAIELKNLTGRRCWVGINQTKVNEICRHFIKTGSLHRLTHGDRLDKGHKFGKSIIDFVSGNTVLEIKSPLTVLPRFGSKTANYAHPGEYERTIRHCHLLTEQAKLGKRAILLMVYLYSAPLFNPFCQNGNNKKFLASIRRATQNGVEFWQANLLLNRTGVQLKNYRKLYFSVQQQ